MMAPVCIHAPAAPPAMSVPARLYIALTVLLGAGILVAALLRWQHDDLPRFYVYLAFALVTAPLKVRLPGISSTMSVNYVFILIGIMLLDLPQTLVAGVLCTLVQCLWHTKERPKVAQLLFNPPSTAMAIACSYAVYHAAWIRRLDGSVPTLLFAASVAYFAANTFSIAGVVALTEGKRPWKVWHESFLWTAPQYLVGAALAGLILLCFERLGWQWALLLGPAVYLIFSSYQLYLGKKTLQAEKELRESREHFQRLVETVKVIRWEMDLAAARYTYVGPQAVRLLGYPLEQWYADGFWEQHVHAEDRERAAGSFREAAARREDHEAQYRMLAADGRELWIRDIATMVADDDGAGRLRGFLIDITEMKETQMMLARQAQELARSNAELQQFAYAASHDLQEPLRMVASYTQLLSKRYKGKLDTTADEFIAYAQDGAVRMHDLISGLLVYARVSTQGREFQPEDCAGVLANALANLRMAVEESGAEVSYDPLPVVRADGPQMVSVFQNLIGNAIKFRGGRTPHVHVSARESGADWLFSVRDNGIGIDAKDFERIFIIFQRLHARDEYPGTGMGLAICRKTIERHGGRIWVESARGEGTTFFFTLPKERKTP